MSIEQKIIEYPNAYQLHEAALFDPKEIVFSDEIRGICEKNGCGRYGTCWACPPAVGSMESCKEKCMQYDHALLFTTATKVEGRFNIQGWKDAKAVHEKITDDIALEFKKEHPNAFVLSTEACEICKDCTYPDKPCRFPDKMHPAVESFGIHVMKLAPKVKIKYNNGEGVVTYFSMILF